MAFQLAPDPGDPGEQRVGTGRVGGADAGERRRIVRDGVQVLAHGALVCPACGLPLAPSGRVRAASDMRCGFCDHAAPARDFLREGAIDTIANEAYLVARVD